VRRWLCLGIVACSTQTARPDVPALAHLEGCYRAAGPEGDQWVIAYAWRGVEILGTTHHHRVDGSISEERERFAVGTDQRWGVTSVLDGEPRGRFVLDEGASSIGNAVFVRDGDEWPKRLAYRQIDSGMRLEVAGDGRTVVMDLGSVACD
jgi:hypothetical protein